MDGFRLGWVGFPVAGHLVPLWQFFVEMPWAIGWSWASRSSKETMPAESPLFFGMHPNAEIDFRTKMSDTKMWAMKFTWEAAAMWLGKWP